MRRFLLLAVVALAGTAFLAIPPADPLPAGTSGPAPAHAVPTPDADALAAAAPARGAGATDSRGGRARGLLLPDGSRVPPLNGVLHPAHLPWPEHRPWSPITGKETEADGVEWYVHADGSRTTTQMHWHHQLGRLDPVTVVFNPVEPTQLLPIALAPSFPNPRP